MRTEEMEKLFSCDEGREEDRCMQEPTAEATDIPETGWAPLWEAYLHKQIYSIRMNDWRRGLDLHYPQTVKDSHLK